MAQLLRPFEDVLYACKKRVIRIHLSSELTMLANLVSRIAQTDWQTRDFTLNGIRDALMEIAASFPVYRTYVTPLGVSADDRRYVEWAVSWARRPAVRENDDVYDFLQKLLLLEPPEQVTTRPRVLIERFAMRFQQYNGAGHGEGPRGHVLLSLGEARVVVRGRRRTESVRRLDRRVSQLQRGAPALVAAHAACRLNP